MAERDTGKPISTPINLTPRARAIIEGIREETGVPNTEAMVRILEWFTSLDRKFRLAILNRDEETKRELFLLVLQQMAGGNDRPSFKKAARQRLPSRGEKANQDGK